MHVWTTSSRGFLCIAVRWQAMASKLKLSDGQVYVWVYSKLCRMAQ